MTNITTLPPKPLTVYSWGDGVADLRYFTTQVFTEKELKNLQNAQGYMPSAHTIQHAVDSVILTLEKGEPGLYFAANPERGTYGRWNHALRNAGWTFIGCCPNSIMGSQVHAFYYIKPGRGAPIKFDFTAKTRNLHATSGDDHSSLWEVAYRDYTSRHKVPPDSEFAFGKSKQFLPNWARLSKNCGVAMGYELPECGKYLDENFFSICAREHGKGFPPGWTPFLNYGGLEFAHNLKKMPGSKTECPDLCAPLT